MGEQPVAVVPAISFFPLGSESLTRKVDAFIAKGRRASDTGAILDTKILRIAGIDLYDQRLNIDLVGVHHLDEVDDIRMGDIRIILFHRSAGYLSHAAAEQAAVALIFFSRCPLNEHGGNLHGTIPFTLILHRTREDNLVANFVHPNPRQPDGLLDQSRQTGIR